MMEKISLALMILGGLNWGLVGIFEFDLVAWIFGGSASLISRIIYVLIALAAIWGITMLFSRSDETAAHARN